MKLGPVLSRTAAAARHAGFALKRPSFFKILNFFRIFEKLGRLGNATNFDADCFPVVHIWSIFKENSNLPKSGHRWRGRRLFSEFNIMTFPSLDAGFGDGCGYSGCSGRCPTCPWPSRCKKNWSLPRRSRRSRRSRRPRRPRRFAGSRLEPWDRPVWGAHAETTLAGL